MNYVGFVVNLSLVFFESDSWTIIFVLKGYAALLWTKVFYSRLVSIYMSNGTVMYESLPKQGPCVMHEGHSVDGSTILSCFLAFSIGFSLAGSGSIFGVI